MTGAEHPLGRGRAPGVSTGRVWTVAPKRAVGPDRHVEFARGDEQRSVGENDRGGFSSRVALEDHATVAPEHGESIEVAGDHAARSDVAAQHAPPDRKAGSRPEAPHVQREQRPPRPAPEGVAVPPDTPPGPFATPPGPTARSPLPMHCGADGPLGPPEPGLDGPAALCGNLWAP